MPVYGGRGLGGRRPPHRGEVERAVVREAQVRTQALDGELRHAEHAPGEAPQAPLRAHGVRVQQDLARIVAHLDPAKGRTLDQAGLQALHDEAARRRVRGLERPREQPRVARGRAQPDERTARREPSRERERSHDAPRARAPRSVRRRAQKASDRPKCTAQRG